MYSPLERENVLSSEQKGCHKGSHETKYQLLIDKWVLRDCKKAYDMVHHSWISECLEVLDIANNVQDFLKNSMKSRKFELNASQKN